MGRKRKYARWGEKYTKEECTKCGWQGVEAEKKLKKVDEYMSEYVCPRCGNKDFYGLLKQ